jgi:hypothetical protein
MSAGEDDASCWHRTPAHNILAVMPTIRLCPSCEQFLATASDAMCRHAEDMHTAISLVDTGLTEPQVDEYKTKLIESFYDAQSAWDSYRAHLKEHGIMPVIPPTQV